MGVNEINSSLPSKAEIEIDFNKIIFVDLSRATLVDVINLFNGIAMKRIIIISTPELLPVAQYWYRIYKQIIAVFCTRTKIDKILHKLRELKTLKREFFSHLSRGEKLTYKDYSLMISHIKDYYHPYKNEGVKSTTSTIYSSTRRLCMKLKIRKLHHLLSF